jgi:hypothetical protein
MTGWPAAGPVFTRVDSVPAGTAAISVSVCIVSFNTRDSRLLHPRGPADCASLGAEVIGDNGVGMGACDGPERFHGAADRECREPFHAAANNRPSARAEAGTSSC